MAPPKRLNKEKVIELHNQGYSNREIALKFYGEVGIPPFDKKPFSPMAIGDIINEYYGNEKPQRDKETKTTAITKVPEPSLDDIEEYLINLRQDAAEVKKLRNVVAALQNENAILKQDKDILEKKERERLDKKQRWELAKQQGDLNPEK